MADWLMSVSLTGGRDAQQHPLLELLDAKSAMSQRLPPALIPTT